VPRQLHEADVGERDPRILGLKPVEPARVLRTTEKHRAAPLAKPVRVVALRVISRAAVRAVAAGNRRRDDDTIADAKVAHALADLLHDTDGLVAEDPSRFDAGHRTANEVEVGSADCARRDADDGVRIVLDRRLLDVVETDVADPVKHDCFHGSLGPRRCWRGPARSARHVPTGVVEDDRGPLVAVAL
jgi:hypothetical protein